METKHYFEKTIGKTHTVFGPFATIQEARRASFLHKHPDAYWREFNEHRTGRVAFGTCGYEDQELACFAADPEAFDYKRVIVKAKAPIHRAWLRAPYTAAFREKYFADCYKAAFGETYEATT
jgi:hypothetical protein